MELLTHPFFTASMALLLSFLVAKLVSFASCHCNSHSPTNSPHHEAITLQEQFTVQSAQSEAKVEFFSPIKVSRNVEIEPQADAAAGEILVESDVVELPVNSDIAVLTAESKARVLNESTRAFGPQVILSANLDNSTAEMVVERKVALGFEEDDWEGIERSELERGFMAATDFVVGSDSGKVDCRLESIRSDVQMELYGLQKVATEEPCREHQPMALNLY